MFKGRIVISVKGSVKFLYSVMDRKQFVTATSLPWLVELEKVFLQVMSYHTSSGWVRKPMRHLEILCSKIDPFNSPFTKLIFFWFLEPDRGEYPHCVMYLWQESFICIQRKRENTPENTGNGHTRLPFPSYLGPQSLRKISFRV